MSYFSLLPAEDVFSYLLGSCGLERRRHNHLRFGLDFLKMLLPLEALGIELVDVFRPGRSGCEPSVLGDDLESADRRLVGRRVREFGSDWLTRKLLGLDHVG